GREALDPLEVVEEEGRQLVERDEGAVPAGVPVGGGGRRDEGAAGRDIQDGYVGVVEEQRAVLVRRRQRPPHGGADGERGERDEGEEAGGDEQHAPDRAAEGGGGHGSRGW